MKFEWGPAVKFCLMFDRTGNYCKFCQAVAHAFHVLILRRSPTFIGFNVPPGPKFNSEQDAVGVPRELQLMGFSATEIGRLASEGAYQLTERNMSEKTAGMIRHVLSSVGGLMVMMGYTDEMTMATVVGAMMTLLAFGWSWGSK